MCDNYVAYLRECFSKEPWREEIFYICDNYVAYLRQCFSNAYVFFDGFRCGLKTGLVESKTNFWP